MPPILNAQSVTKQFGATPLFRNISLTVEDGDRIGLIGPNGAGKSTLLAILAGQVEPDSGELAVRKRARAAYVPQDSRFAPGLTIRQLSMLAISLAEGFAIWDRLDPTMSRNILRPTGREGEKVEWTLFSMGIEALLWQFAELEEDADPPPGPGVSATRVVSMQVIGPLGNRWLPTGPLAPGSGGSVRCRPAWGGPRRTARRTR